MPELCEARNKNKIKHRCFEVLSFNKIFDHSEVSTWVFLSSCFLYTILKLTSSGKYALPAQHPSSSQKLFTTLIIELLIVHVTLDFTQTVTTLC